VTALIRPLTTIMRSRSLLRSTKELIRKSLTASGSNWLHLMVRRAQGQNLDHLRGETTSERFQYIYRQGTWLSGDRLGSLSGIGSAISATQKLRDELPSILSSLKTQRLLDVGCGDFGWLKEVDLPCEYVGIDIVPDIVVLNLERYSRPGRLFLSLDATTCPLPRADTILCREVLFHLSFRDIRKLIGNVIRSGARFLLATNDEGLRFNSDILSGDFRLLNLEKEPFFFPKPLLVTPDDAVNPDRVISVWDVSRLLDE
jgi:SAM-dependent methyltransferase